MIKIIRSRTYFNDEFAMKLPYGYHGFQCFETLTTWNTVFLDQLLLRSDRVVITLNTLRSESYNQYIQWSKWGRIRGGDGIPPLILSKIIHSSLYTKIILVFFVKIVFFFYDKIRKLYHYFGNWLISHSFWYVHNLMKIWNFKNVLINSWVMGRFVNSE